MSGRWLTLLAVIRFDPAANKRVVRRRRNTWLQRLLDELHELMGGAERSTPVPGIIEPSALLSTFKVSHLQPLPSSVSSHPNRTGIELAIWRKMTGVWYEQCLRSASVAMTGTPRRSLRPAINCATLLAKVRLTPDMHAIFCNVSTDDGRHLHGRCPPPILSSQEC